MKKFCFLSIFVLFVFTGCGGGGVNVSGKVTFEDGTPLTMGEVAFQTASFIATGLIQPDGTYTLGSLKAGDGVPKGTYNVTVKAVSSPPVPPGALSDPNYKPAPAKHLIDLKFASQSTSGLTCQVDGKTTFNITVTPPGAGDAPQ